MGLASFLASASEVSQASKLYRCTGAYRSYSCTTTLQFNHCKNSIKVEWKPLRMPGSEAWAKSHRTWCTVTWSGVNAVEEHMYRPEKCEELVKILAAGFEGLPELKWQDANCNINGGADGILYLSQHWERPKPQEHFTAPTPDPDPEPKAARLEDARACVLHNEKKRELVCPVMPQLTQSWLRKFLNLVEVSLTIRNELK